MKKVKKYIILILSVITVAAIGTAVYFGINSIENKNKDKVFDTNKEENNNFDHLRKDNIETEFITQLDKTKLIDIDSVKKRDLNKIEQDSQIVVKKTELTEIISYSYDYNNYDDEILLGNFKINFDGSLTIKKMLVSDISYDDKNNIVNYKIICDVSTEEIRLDNDNKAVAIDGFYYEPADAINLFLMTEEGYIFFSELNYDNKNLSFIRFDNNIYKNLILISLPLLDAHGTGDEIPFGFFGQTKDDQLIFIIYGSEQAVYKEEQYPHTDSAFGFLAVFKDSTFKILNDTDFIEYNNEKLMIDRAFSTWESLSECIYFIDSEKNLYKLSYVYESDGLSSYNIVKHSEAKIKKVYFNKQIGKSSDGSEYEYINNIFVEYDNNKIEKFSTDSFETYNFGEEN